ncbi:MAG: phage portal protein, partial [Nitrococcus sp.]|nr:phage portal protein [Nitrococcus sp.]
MSALSWILSLVPRAAYGPDDDFWYGPLAPKTAAGVSVTPARALQCAAVYACIKVLSESVASLPLKIYERLENGDKREARTHSLYALLHDQPNADQTAWQFFLMQQASLAARGNAYAVIKSGALGVVDQLIPLDPDSVVARRDENGQARYEVHDNGKTTSLTAN